ncbi:hypothetical protein KI387_003500, partial [Taxus chinensis]
TEEETEDMEISEMGGVDDSDPKWYDTQEILQAERAERSAERMTLVSGEVTLSQDLGGDGESIAGHHVALDVDEGHQSMPASVA